LKPTLQLAKTITPDGHRLVLSQHDRDFYICLDTYTLMTSRERASELELARLGCQGLRERQNPQVLIGGLGMGFTLRQTLELLPERAKVTVAELIPEVVVWNRNFLGDLTDHPLQDRRVVVQTCDVIDVINASADRFDAILLDVDNGPSAMTLTQNAELYRPTGLHAMMRALKAEGCLAIWSVNGDTQFEKTLKREKLGYRLCRVAASKSAKSRSRYIWLIAQDKQWLPKT
jgi:spermidine synthase